MCIRRPVLLLIASALALVSSPLLAQDPLPAGPWQPTAEEAELAARTLGLLNEARAAEGLEPLRAAPDLTLLAFQHAREMASRDSLTHHSYLFGVDTESRVRLAFPRIFQFAENVARNRSPETLNTALLASRGHRLNRLDPGFTHVGIGIARASEHQLYLAEVFVRTANPELLTIDVLYSTRTPEELPDDVPTLGEVRGETIVVPAPGPDNPEHWTRRGIEAFDSGRFGEAVGLFQKALEIDSGYGYARFNLARAHLSAGDAERALAMLDRHLADEPEDIDAWYTRGTASVVSGRFELAEQAFRKVLAARERDAGAWYNLGLSLEYQDRLEGAESAYAQALHLDSGLLAARDALARLRR